MESCNRVLFHRRQSLSKVLGHIKIFTKTLLNLHPPRPLFNVESWLPHICVGHWYSNIKPNIEWGGGGGQIFLRDNCGKANVTWNRWCPNYFWKWLYMKYYAGIAVLCSFAAFAHSFNILWNERGKSKRFRRRWGKLNQILFYKGVPIWCNRWFSFETAWGTYVWANTTIAFT